MRTKLILGVVLFLTLVFTNSAFSSGFDAFYTVGTDGSTTLKNTFGWNEQPWLYLNFPSSGLSVMGSWWQNPSGDKYYFAGSEQNTDKEKWISLEDWGSKKETGLWNIDGMYYYANNPSDPFGAGTTSFTVTPEPVNSALFLLGGTFLAFGYRWKAKRKKKV